MTPLTRRRLLAGAGSLSLVGLVGGCANETHSPEERPSASTEGTFPATVTHKYGSTEIPAAPERIVSVGLTGQDTLLALGHVAVAVTEWYNEQPDATWPWAHDLLDGARPEVLDGTDGLQFERIASLAPDLIVGTNAGLTQEDYDKLSEIAPTVANTGEYEADHFEPWPAQTLLLGQALGQEAAAQQLIDDLKAQFTDAAAGNPQFAGKMAILLQAPYYEGNAIAYQKGLSTEFLTDLGFDIPAELDQFSEGAQAYIPVEKLDVLDAGDVLIWATEDEKAEQALAESTLFGQLRAVREGRSPTPATSWPERSTSPPCSACRTSWTNCCPHCRRPSRRRDPASPDPDGPRGGKPVSGFGDCRLRQGDGPLTWPRGCLVSEVLAHQPPAHIRSARPEAQRLD